MKKRVVAKRGRGRNQQKFDDYNHGRSDVLPAEFAELHEVSQGSGTLFDVAETNLDSGMQIQHDAEIVDPNAIKITSANIGPMIMVALLAAAIVISFVGAIVYSIENPGPDRPYRPEPVNTDPFHPCYGLTARECKWN